MAKTHFQNLFEARINEVIASETGEIIRGLPSDFPSYREMVGYINGLHAALLLCAQIEEEYNK